MLAEQQTLKLLDPDRAAALQPRVKLMAPPASLGAQKITGEVVRRVGISSVVPASDDGA